MWVTGMSLRASSHDSKAPVRLPASEAKSPRKPMRKQSHRPSLPLSTSSTMPLPLSSTPSHAASVPMLSGFPFESMAGVPSPINTPCAVPDGVPSFDPGGGKVGLPPAEPPTPTEPAPAPPAEQPVAACPSVAARARPSAMWADAQRRVVTIMGGVRAIARGRTRYKLPSPPVASA
jgi:hypothetical protein